MSLEIELIFKQKADYYDATLSTFNEYRSAAHQTGLKTLKWLADFSVFTLMGAHDLWIVICDYQRATKKYQQIYYSRQASLICFELLEDVSQHFNENFSRLMLDSIDNHDINEKSGNLRKTFNKLRKENVSKLKAIRNCTIAHREHDVSKQIDLINGIDNEWIINFSLEYLKQIEEMHSVINAAIKHIGSDSATLNQDALREKYGI